MSLEFSDKGSYAGLSSNGWANDPPNPPAGTYTCDALYPLSSNVSAYIPQANALCKKIIEVSSGSVYALLVQGTGSTFSVVGWFPDSLLYCVGSSGNTFGKAWGDGPPTPNPNVVYNNVGCLSNP